MKRKLKASSYLTAVIFLFLCYILNSCSPKYNDFNISRFSGVYYAQIWRHRMNLVWIQLQQYFYAASLNERKSKTNKLKDHIYTCQRCLDYLSFQDRIQAKHRVVERNLRPCVPKVVFLEEADQFNWLLPATIGKPWISSSTRRPNYPLPLAYYILLKLSHIGLTLITRTAENLFLLITNFEEPNHSIQVVGKGK